MSFSLLSQSCTISRLPQPCLAIVPIAKTHSSDCKSKLAGVVNFVTGNLRPVRSDVDESLSHWYKSNSRVFVSHNHACWLDPTTEKKVRKKRFGAVIRSPQSSLVGMMQHHTNEVQQYILSAVAGGGETTESEGAAPGGLVDAM